MRAHGRLRDADDVVHWDGKLLQLGENRDLATHLLVRGNGVLWGHGGRARGGGGGGGKGGRGRRKIKA